MTYFPRWFVSCRAGSSFTTNCTAISLFSTVNQINQIGSPEMTHRLNSLHAVLETEPTESLDKSEIISVQTCRHYGCFSGFKPSGWRSSCRCVTVWLLGRGAGLLLCPVSWFVLLHVFCCLSVRMVCSCVSQLSGYQGLPGYCVWFFFFQFVCL